MNTVCTAHAESMSYFATLPLYPILDPGDTVVYIDIDDSQLREEGNKKDVKNKKKIGRME
jgi:hypothetical protein